MASENTAQSSSGDGGTSHPSYDGTFVQRLWNGDACFRPPSVPKSDPFCGYVESAPLQEGMKESPTGSNDAIPRSPSEDWRVGLEILAKEYDQAPSLSNAWDPGCNEFGIPVKAEPHSQAESDSLWQEFGELNSHLQPHWNLDPELVVEE